MKFKQNDKLLINLLLILYDESKISMKLDLCFEMFVFKNVFYIEMINLEFIL